MKSQKRKSSFTYESLYDTLKIKRSTYREWSNKLVPNPHWKSVGSTVFLFFRTMRDMIREMGVAASEMSANSWSQVYVHLRDESLSDIRNSYLVFDRRDQSLNFIDKSDLGERSKYLKELPMSEVIDEHLSLILNFGNDEPDKVVILNKKISH